MVTQSPCCRGRRKSRFAWRVLTPLKNHRHLAQNPKPSYRHSFIARPLLFKKTGTDNYGRTLARINVNGKDAAEFMLSKGMAWHYKEYSKDQTLSEMEQKARTAKLGLWSEENALAPWEFRRRQKDNSRSGTDGKIVAADASSSPKDATGLGYWLNTSSNTRHNASCQYFKNTKRGRACDKSDGKACGTCGG